MNIKRKLRIYIPLAAIILFLLYSWYEILLTDTLATYQNHLALLFFAPVLFLIFKDKSLKKVILATGVYLILALINIFTLLPYRSKTAFGIRLGEIDIWTPAINIHALIILIIYLVLNFDALVEIHLDYKESKGKL